MTSFNEIFSMQVSNTALNTVQKLILSTKPHCRTMSFYQIINFEFKLSSFQTRKAAETHHLATLGVSGSVDDSIGTLTDSIQLHKLVH